ncbi:MAG: hypothetical protein AAF927_02600 [Bacteroidota bacterium]
MKSRLISLIPLLSFYVLTAQNLDIASNPVPLASNAEYVLAVSAQSPPFRQGSGLDNDGPEAALRQDGFNDPVSNASNAEILLADALPIAHPQSQQNGDSLSSSNASAPQRQAGGGKGVTVVIWPTRDSSSTDEPGSK